MQGNVYKIAILGVGVAAIMSCAKVQTSQTSGSRSNNDLRGNASISKVVYFNAPDLGDISSIYSVSNNLQTKEIIFTGSNKVVFYDVPIKRIVDSVENVDHNALIYIEGKSHERALFYSKTTPVAVYDDRGGQVWRDSLDGQFMDMAYGHAIDRDSPNFAIAYNKWRTSSTRSSTKDILPTTGVLRLFNGRGKMLWNRATSELWRLAFVDINGDGKDEILSSDYSGKIIARNERGDIVLSYDQLMSRNYSICNWPGSGSPKRILYSLDEKFWIRDLDGNLLAKYEAPASGQYEVQAVPVIFVENRKPYFAAIVKVKASKSEAYLYIYTPQGNLIYRELIPAKYVAMNVLNKGGTETLLVGGNNVVWQYIMK